MKLILRVFGILSAIYLFLVMPRMTKRKEVEKFKNRFYAHRGLHDNKSDAPENSLPAFVKAVEAGYGIELDVQVTKDGVLVVFHDETIERMCSEKGKVSEYTYDELKEFRLLNTQEYIPTFRQVLEVVDGKVPLIVEIKMYAMDEVVCSITNEHLESYNGDYCVESFNPLAVRWFKKNKPEIIRGQLSSALNIESNAQNPVYFIVEHLLSNVVTRPDFIAYNHKFKNRLGRNICKRLFKCFSVTWTIKSQEELEEAKDDFDIFIFEGFIPILENEA